MHKMVSRTPAKSKKSVAPSVTAKKPRPAGKSRNVPTVDPRHACFKLEIKPSKIHRWGVYAAEDIPVRRKVMEYTGERINRKETKRRSEEQDKLIYLFTLDSYWTLDGSVATSSTSPASPSAGARN